MLNNASFFYEAVQKYNVGQFLHPIEIRLNCKSGETLYTLAQKSFLFGKQIIFWHARKTKVLNEQNYMVDEGSKKTCQQISFIY